MFAVSVTWSSILRPPLEDHSQVPNTLPESQIASRSWYSRWSMVVQRSLQQHSHCLPFGDSQLVAGCPALQNCHDLAAAPRSSSALLLFPGIRITRSSAYAMGWVFGSSSAVSVGRPLRCSRILVLRQTLVAILFWPVFPLCDSRLPS